MKRAILCALFLPFVMQAQENENTLDELIIQNNRISIPFTEQNRNVSVLTAQEIKALPAKSINELLTYVSGIDIRQRGPFGTQADVSIDGGSFEQTLILLNGIRISDHQTAHNSLNIPIPTEAIERIEILKGPAARIYGVNSLTGAINIVTKKPIENSFYAHAFGGTNFKKDKEETNEMFNGRGLQLGLTLVNKKFQQQLFGSYESGSGYRYNTAYHNNKVFYQADFQANENNNYNALAGYANSNFGANGFYAAPGDKEAKEIVQTFMFAMQSKHRLSDNFVLMPQIGYRYNYDDYRYFRHKLDVARSQHYSNSLNAQLNANYQVNFGEFGFGIEGRYEQINSSNIGDHERENFGFYAEFRTQEIEKVDVTIGAYTNYNSVFGWQVFPGLDFSYLIQPDFKFIASAGTSQRIPSFTDLYLDQRPGNVGNPNLISEKAIQYEGGFKFENDAFNAKAIVFYRDINDFIDWTRLSTDVPWQANNVGSLRTTGVNASFDYRLNTNKSDWKFKLTYTYLSPKMEGLVEDNSSKYKIENFRHQLVNVLQWSNTNWSVLIANRYNERISYKNYFLTDLRVSYQYKKFNYYIDAQNIFDKAYIEAGAVTMPGRWLSVGIKFNTGI